eukprot:GSMAST32.ASY1.ANO1.837.1 assembled CDS
MKIVLYSVILSCLIVSSFAATSHLRGENHEQQPEEYKSKRNLKFNEDGLEVIWNPLRAEYDTNNNLAMRNDQRVASIWSLDKLSPELPSRDILDFLGLSFLNPWSKTCLRKVVDKMIYPLHVFEKFSKNQIPADDLQRRIETGTPVQDVVNRMFREYGWTQLSLDEKKERFAREVEIRGLEMKAPFYSPLLEAANKNDVMKVETLIVLGENVNQANGDGDTPLLIASQEGHAGVVAKLIAAGADVNQAREGGFTPLYISSLNGHVGVVRLLLDKGADVNQADNNEYTPLFNASSKGHEKVVQLLLGAKAKVNQALTSGAASGATPLFVASHSGYDKVVEQLIAAGADVNKALQSGATPLYAASINGHVGVVEQLIDHGANVNDDDDDGVTPLHVASQSGHLKVVAKLIAAHADAKANFNGLTPLMIASQNATPLYISSQNGHVGIVGLLLGKGANVNLATKYGATPLWVASWTGHEEVVQVLLDAGADVNQAVTSGPFAGVTPLLIASHADHAGVVRLLKTLDPEFVGASNSKYKSQSE